MLLLTISCSRLARVDGRHQVMEVQIEESQLTHYSPIALLAKVFSRSADTIQTILAFALASAPRWALRPLLR